ncbi:lipopolysaccharide assembly protein LapA domain-containing protein [Aurantimonas sp. VKM B-3413]|uniref:lipopolysaccharide assembly protein LapA domain-containing protein n=1 Tax=Aurantimonas sp. VKM B-3413 TaxID=2779401 RepID=UPI001E4A6FF7|nr:LapA family protein [Aurantimonas sp. VKM B-3413]MCB8839607.1 lipopolysaccharide assembly protein LapA domain-containing protein [Aurantimonas sp. VKM B-3413]
MIAKILSFIILVPIAIILVVFCVANRELVPVSLDPIGTMPQFAFQAPLFILLMGSVILGIVLGGLGTWFTQAHYRRKSWKRKYEVERLRREAEEHKARARQLQEERDRAALAPPTGAGSTAIVTSRAA